MSDGQVTLRIADTPPSLNTYANDHWAKQRRIKDQWQTRIRLSLFKEQLPRKCDRIEARVAFRFPTRRRRDLGNFQSTLEKFLGDALQPDFLEDDTHDRFTVVASIEDEPGEALTTITLNYWGGSGVGVPARYAA